MAKKAKTQKKKNKRTKLTYDSFFGRILTLAQTKAAKKEIVRKKNSYG